MKTGAGDYNSFLVGNGIGNGPDEKKLQRSASCPEVFPLETKVYTSSQKNITKFKQVRGVINQECESLHKI